MAIFELFSKKQKKLRGDIPDVYVYDSLPEPLRVQIIHIWNDSLGDILQYFSVEDVQMVYKFIVETLCREYGRFELSSSKIDRERVYITELNNYFLEEHDVEKQLDVVEITFKLIDTVTRDFEYLAKNDASKIADSAIDELNARFKEHGIGFQFTNSEIIRVDSELLHTEAVKPALLLLNQSHYEGAQEEFLFAYEHYRHGRHKESLNDCLKAFESTMKSICDKHGWFYQQNATAKSLIQICFERGLVPTFWQQQMTSLRSLLESSVPTGRNKLSGHGQGSNTIEIPDYLVAYMLHMTASTLVFLTTAESKIA
ncbi:STM4504/CBY_0614 family protein [Vibrio vulnificus]|uniref:STM4504/CBY_0614 family protein n=1 Tax=Vibrio vulnificus TaxID=672 RepID=UPI003ED85C42